MIERKNSEKSEFRPIRTQYMGPSRVTSLTFGKLTIKLARPSDPDQLLNDPAVLDLNRAEDYMPYWAYLWPGAYLLADFVAREAWIPDNRALELGCGLGLAGLVGVAAGLRVDFTDYDDAPLQFVDNSLLENRFETEVGRTFLLDWRDPGETTYPVILGADLLYEKRLVPLVCDVIKKLLEPAGVAYVAGPYRVATEGLHECMAVRGLRSDAEEIQLQSTELGPLRGTLHRIRHEEQNGAQQ
jgi:predicted nicotinamide N-methyase